MKTILKRIGKLAAFGYLLMSLGLVLGIRAAMEEGADVLKDSPLLLVGFMVCWFLGGLICLLSFDWYRAGQRKEALRRFNEQKESYGPTEYQTLY